MQNINIPKVGQIVEGQVIKVEHNTLYVDLSAMTEGKIHLDNYSKPSPESFIGLIKVGDLLRGKIQKITDEPAQILLSRLPLLDEQDFEALAQIVKDEVIVKAKVKSADEKGLVLQYKSFELFLPFSLLDFDLQKEKDTLKGRTLDIHIIEAERKGRRERIIASRKKIFEAARQEAYQKRVSERQEELLTIKTGDVLKGIVDKIETHAATIRFDHVIGLLRISQVSHHRIEKIEEKISKGDEIEVKVIKKEGSRLDLSMKALQKTPYELFQLNFQVSDKVSGVVVQKLPFGIIVELAQDVRGLLHRSEYSWNPNDNYDAFVKIGQEVQLAIVSLDIKKEKIGLSRKVLLDNPWKDVTAKRGDVVVAKVTSLEKNHIVVNVQGADGIIKNDEISTEKNVKIDDHFTIGQEVEALVIQADRNTWNLLLSIRILKEKQLRDDFEKFMESEQEDQSGTSIGDLFEETLKKRK